MARRMNGRRCSGVLLLLWLGVPALAQGAGAWSPAGELSVGRYAPGAALLPDGRVVVAGGYSFELNRTHDSSDVFDPQMGKWSPGSRMRFDRNFPLVLPLAGGDALFTAGFRSRTGTTATTERLRGGSATFELEASPDNPPTVEERELFAATPLADGRVLITGGYSTLRRKTLNSAEVFDPKKQVFTAVRGSLSFARFGHTGVLLPDGRVLIVGGKVLATNDDVRDAELFDPKTETFRPAGMLAVGRDRVTAWLSADKKRVLVAGGSAKEGGTAPARRCEWYEIGAGTFSPGPELLRDRMAHTATPLPDGRVLLIGGWSTSDNRTTRQAELWDPKAERFVDAGQTQVGRHDHVAVLLKDGRVLLAGGKEAPAREGVESPLAAELWSDKR